MSSVNIIASIIVLLAALVCYAFVAQTLAPETRTAKTRAHSLEGPFTQFQIYDKWLS